MLSLKAIKRLRLGGTRDTVTGVALLSGGLSTNPFFSVWLKKLLGEDFQGWEITQARRCADALGVRNLICAKIYSLSQSDVDQIVFMLQSMLGVSISAVAGGLLAKRIADSIFAPAFFKSELSLRSSAVPGSDPTERAARAARKSSGRIDREKDAGLMLGYCIDTGEPVVIPYEDVMRHMFILGQSGVGKTVLGGYIMQQHISSGGGVIFVDGKMDVKNLAAIHAACAWAGREDDLLVINPGNPEMSNSYNPFLFGDADEVASRILLLNPSTDSSPGADYFKQAANQGLLILVAALNKAGLAYNSIDLSILLMNQKALTYLENRVPPSNEKTNLSLFLDQYRVTNKDGVSSIDMKRLKETFGGVGGRLFTFGTGKFGQVMNTYSPDVNLFEAVKQKKIIYVMLPTMGKDNAAMNFGKIFIGDLRTTISWLQAMPDEEKPWPPCMAFCDEPGAYISDSWNRMFEQSRSAHMFFIPSPQTVANLDAISPELREMVLGNTWTKVFFKIGTMESAEIAAEIIGKEMRVQDSVSASGGESQSGADATTPSNSGSTSANSGIGERGVEEYKVSPYDLTALDKGEAIVSYAGNKVYHIRVPQIKMSEATGAETGPVRLNYFRSRFVKGIDLFRRADQYLSTSSGTPE
ncbi:MAG: TraM recognition domain-containing protein [Sideroxydans sp.]|nr:TraM recognition domain-containing protein [Sideroxydans sp.]MDD5056653.1 TraM recognition domain-containing protein [Sideroxydans sp.]